ncbi:hypothetical protein ARAM_000664 [Aspergillus rambellii]|uniref:Uncharacterized protein n=1 Tax=Aspergillus rambellii TaxID=308745 RepID=A0A0F8UY09_9EURO|nr:hypothetical protein ARAM_000664 [Aspergillus rambellii]
MEGTSSAIAQSLTTTDRVEPMKALQDFDHLERDGNERGHPPVRNIKDDVTPILPADVVRPKPLTLSPDNSSLSSQQGKNPHKSPSSPEFTPQRSPLQSHSPASLIFERNVQEDILLPQASPSIPSHIRTENYIPPVLEASSAAITDSQLDPDSVEIVTHSIHHPAASSVVPGEHSLQSSWSESGGDMNDSEELSSSNRGSDMADVRRLSFISFADVVNAENAETSEYSFGHDSAQGSPTLANPSGMVYQNISLSPLHSPISSHGFGTSPPTSISASFKGLELSPNRGARGTESPLLTVQRPVSPSLNGELNIETMRQALRRTGSRDLGVSRSQVTSMTGNND